MERAGWEKSRGSTSGWQGEVRCYKDKGGKARQGKKKLKKKGKMINKKKLVTDLAIDLV